MSHEPEVAMAEVRAHLERGVDDLHEPRVTSRSRLVDGCGSGSARRQCH